MNWSTKVGDYEVTLSKAVVSSSRDHWESEWEELIVRYENLKTGYCGMHEFTMDRKVMAHKFYNRLSVRIRRIQTGLEKDNPESWLVTDADFEWLKGYESALKGMRK